MPLGVARRACTRSQTDCGALALLVSDEQVAFLRERQSSRRIVQLSLNAEGSLGHYSRLRAICGIQRIAQTAQYLVRTVGARDVKEIGRLIRITTPALLCDNCHSICKNMRSGQRR